MMKIALITDTITSSSLQLEANTYHITPLNYKVILKFWKPDMLFVESAWQGYRNRWKYKIASYPHHLRRNNKRLSRVVAHAKKLGIPTVFWNKEDGIHFERFIESAKLFDHIFTVDQNCIPKYREVVKPGVTVNTLMFAVQSSLHNFTGFNFKYNQANFAGSYSHHIHDRRRVWQNMIFQAACQSRLNLSVWDRNSDRKSSDYRYPNKACINIKPSIPYGKTAQIYKDHLISLNVNTIEDSETMFSRRLIEILACGGIAVTNASPAVERYFKDYCYVVSSETEATKLFDRLKKGPNEEDLKRARAGAEYVAKEHTWTHRLEEIRKIIGL